MHCDNPTKSSMSGYVHNWLQEESRQKPSVAPLVRTPSFTGVGDIDIHKEYHDQESQEDMAKISSAELIAHNKQDSCWIAIHGTVWDVTSFLQQHPGGSSLILRVAGQDATEHYEAFHHPGLAEKTLGPEARRGTLEGLPVSKKARPKMETHRKIPSLRSMISLKDFEILAEEIMAPVGWAYVTSGADDEVTLRYNARAYEKVFLRGRILRNVSSLDLSTTILGQKSSLPVYTSAVGLGKIAHPDGECAIAQADGKEGVIQVVNTQSSWSIEDIMKARVSEEQPIFWQLYMNPDRSVSEEFVQRVERLGVKAIWLTVDAPVTGNREKDERSKSAEEVEESLESIVEMPSIQGRGIASGAIRVIASDVEWQAIDWLRSITKLPIVIKGIQSVEDAVLAYENGVDGIVLSNHGGRSQDTSQPPLLTLLEIRRHAPHIMNNRMQIFVDGGVRRGTDVLKAMCLGATAVGIGRPTLYSMSGGYGQYGVRRMIQILRKEIRTNMAYLGATRISELKPEMVNAKKARANAF